jgi:hypothetical protein
MTRKNSSIILLIYKQLTAMERGRKIEELQKRLIESETLRNRCTRKLTLLKDQVILLVEMESFRLLKN